MAAVFDINLLSNQILGEHIITGLFDEYKINIKTITQISSWMWENEQEIKSFDQTVELLNNNRILVLQLQHPLVKDLGMYIEKVDAFYHYTFWVNTQNYGMMDCDEITTENSRYYEEIYQIISKINQAAKDSCEVVGIGLETDFQYRENIIYTIQNARNITVWILNRNTEYERGISGYTKRNVEGLKMTVLEKRT